jgi:hypothetical protein
MLLHLSKAFEVKSTQRTLIILNMGFRGVENFHVLFSGTYYLRIKLANLLLRFEVVKLVR